MPNTCFPFSNQRFSIFTAEVITRITTLNKGSFNYELNEFCADESDNFIWLPT